MKIPSRQIDKLVRKAIPEKRLIQFVYKGKPRIVEPHDYGIHKGSVKLFGYQVGGMSSAPLAELALGASELDFRSLPAGGTVSR